MAILGVEDEDDEGHEDSDDRFSYCCWYAAHFTLRSFLIQF
jgi:hypothetical protein